MCVRECGNFCFAQKKMIINRLANVHVFHVRCCEPARLLSAIKQQFFRLSHAHGNYRCRAKRKILADAIHIGVLR